MDVREHHGTFRNYSQKYIDLQIPYVKASHANKSILRLTSQH